VSNARAHDYDFEEEIDLLFFDDSRSRETTTKYAKEIKRKKNRPFLQTKTRDR